MSASGPKRTWVSALHMSAFGGKADMTVCGNPLSRSLLGAKRTCLFAEHMSAFDPKRTSRNLATTIIGYFVIMRVADGGG
jgi:hypothetical protein